MKPLLARLPRRFPLVIKVRWLPDGTKVEERYTSWLVFKCWWRFRITKSYQRDRANSLVQVWEDGEIVSNE